MSKLVFVYTIPRTTATGLSEFTNDSSGVKLKKTKMGKCTDWISALYDPKIGGLRNYISYTPWIEEGVQKVDEKGNPLTLQDKMEQKWNKPKGYFTNMPPTKEYKGDGSDLPYFQRKNWVLRDGCTVFDLNNMDDEMGYYVLLASSKVANSEREWREHKWPKAQWYIALENESEEIKYTRNSIRSKAYASLHDPALTDALKRKFVSVLDISSSTAKLSVEQVHNLLFTFIEQSTFTPNSNIEKFLTIINLLRTADGRVRFDNMYILKQALDLRIVYEKQGTYTWIRPNAASLVIGDRYDEALDFLASPKKTAEIEELLSQIELKSK